MRRCKADAEQTRSSIMDAAERMFVKNGVGQTSLEQIARAAGVTRGAVYWHFKDKADLLQAMYERNKPPQVELLRMAAPCSDDPLTLLETTNAEILSLIESDEGRQRMFALLCNHIPVEGNAHRQEAMNTAMYQLLLQLMERARETDTLTDSLTPHEAAVSLMIMTNGLLSEWLRSGKAFGLTDLGMRLVRRHLETLRKRPRAG